MSGPARDGSPVAPTEGMIDFLIIGAQKAGTSWLHERLRRVPGLWLPPDKDDEYFSYPGAVPEAAFRARFADAPRGVRVGDACASYFWTTGREAGNTGFAADPAAIIDAALGPETRYIVLLRDPLERALSGYLHHISFGTLDPRVPLLDAPGSLGLVEIGRYGRHLAAWLEQVAPERLCVRPAPGEVPPQSLLTDVADFLEVDPVDATSDEVVFPGLRRWRNADGVWVALGQPGVESPVGPVAEFDGQAATRLVDAETIESVCELLRPDTERLADELRELGWIDPAYARWPTWPASG